MTALTTFYLSRLIGCDIYDARENVLGKILDVYVQLPVTSTENTKPTVIGFLAKTNSGKRIVVLNDLEIVKFGVRYKIQCNSMTIKPDNSFVNSILLKETILDKQIVDITGHKLVRVNDIRMVAIPSGIYLMAVDVGMEGLLRRIGINRTIRTVLRLFNQRIPSKFILWDDVESVDPVTLSIYLSKTRSKLNTLHPSDLADIIEDLGKSSKARFFSVLDEEKAADVLEELEVKEQVHIIESLSVEKAADVLEKMPANEAADLMDNLEDHKTEQLLLEMEQSASDEVRDLLEYPDSTVGSIMTTNVLVFTKEQTVADVLDYIKKEKPDIETLYAIFIIENDKTLSGTLTMRDLLIVEKDTPLEQIMNVNTPSVNDYDRLDSLSELISKYNLLAVPVLNDENELEGMVVVDDVIDDLLDKRRTL